MKKCAALLTLLAAGNVSFAANIYWKSTAAGSSDFADPANWSAAYTTSSDSLRVGGPTNTYPYSSNLARITTGWGAVDSTVNDALVVGGYLYQGNFELACGSGGAAYFRSIILGDTKLAAEGASVMTITSGKLSHGPIASDTGYLTVGRNNTSYSTTNGVGYLFINGGEVNMDRITIGELKAGNAVAGEGHVVLQNDGIINLPCEKVFDPPSMVGLKVNSGDFTWNDNGNSSVTTGFLLVNTATLIFQSADNSFGTDGKGILVNSGMPSGDGSAVFTTDALIDVTGLAATTDWVTLITAANGITVTNLTLMTAVTNAPLLTKASVAKGWAYRLLDLDGEAGNATALQVRVMPLPTLVCSAANGTLTVSWPSEYLGWTLQMQTFAGDTGLTTWSGADIPGTESVTSVGVTMDPGSSMVLFRLRY